jgi:hypothetical protein
MPSIARVIVLLATALEGVFSVDTDFPEQPAIQTAIRIIKNIFFIWSGFSIKIINFILANPEIERYIKEYSKLF